MLLLYDQMTIHFQGAALSHSGKNKGNSVKKESLRIAYAIQNVGGIDLACTLGDAVPVRYSLQGLQREGHRVTLFLLSGRSIMRIEDLSRLDDRGLVSLGISDTQLFLLVESGIRRLQHELKLPYFAFFDTYRFYEACQRGLQNYDLCHEHNGLFCLGAALACRRLNLPYVLTFSADPLFEQELVGKPLTGLHKKVAAWEAGLTYKLARKIICVSQQSRRRLIDIWQVDPSKIVVMPNGVDVDLFTPDQDAHRARAELKLDENPVIVFVGSFQMWHGLFQLVDSFMLVLAEFPDARLLLVGDGPARVALEQRIAELGIGHAVVITGFLPQARVPEMLAAADVAVVPYPALPEELWFSPLKLYEYMAAGKPIVASRAGQIAEVIQDGLTGILVEPGSVSELGHAICFLLNNPVQRKRLGGNARQQAVAHHSWAGYVSRLEEVYRSVLQ